ncbi:hypothetical protein [Geothrix sp. 21YS21S-2]|uniref:hypothetical protein n=1 Tax=Geothrix sp. 21YS21S-2 TaxID=3068893 RepID=UPI0027BB0152|nr:hypothetical protein [Geothrix sp. 21YS21S-2]
MHLTLDDFSRNPLKFLPAALKGEEVILVVDGEAVARLEPIEKAPSVEDHRERLATIPDDRLGKGKPPLPTLIKMSGEGPSASDMILEDRR